jgi:hypothetical protein
VEQSEDTGAWTPKKNWYAEPEFTNIKSPLVNTLHREDHLSSGGRGVLQQVGRERRRPASVGLLSRAVHRVYTPGKRAISAVKDRIRYTPTQVCGIEGNLVDWRKEGCY